MVVRRMLVSVCVLCLFVCLLYQGCASEKANNSQSILQRAAGLSYNNGDIKWLTLDSRDAYVIKPKTKVNPQRRWVWVSPMWLSVLQRPTNPLPTKADYEWYIESLLKNGFYVVGIDVGTSLGGPKGAKLYNKFYDFLMHKYHLNPKARFIGQSNGGLIAYAWAFRNPKKVDRILGIYPALDLRDWPGLNKVVGPNSIGDPVYGFGSMTMDQLKAHLSEVNPIDNLKPLADAGVKILHIHGDSDSTVHFIPNSQEALFRYRALGGDIEVVPVKGLDHGPNATFYCSQKALDFLLQ